MKLQKLQLLHSLEVVAEVNIHNYEEGDETHANVVNEVMHRVVISQKRSRHQ